MGCVSCGNAVAVCLCVVCLCGAPVCGVPWSMRMCVLATVYVCAVCVSRAQGGGSYICGCGCGCGYVRTTHKASYSVSRVVCLRKPLREENGHDDTEGRPTKGHVPKSNEHILKEEGGRLWNALHHVQGLWNWLRRVTEEESCA